MEKSGGVDNGVICSRRDMGKNLPQNRSYVIASFVTITVITSTSPTRTPKSGLDALPNGLFMALFMIAVPRILSFPLLKPFLLIHPPVPLYVLLVPVTKTVSMKLSSNLLTSRLSILGILKTSFAVTGVTTVTSDGTITLCRVFPAETVI